MCDQCAVSLVYHQLDNHLCCHYCGYQTSLPASCGDCRSPHIHNVGFGTEKLEESLQLFFPNKQVQRMDLDTTKGKYSYHKIINAFETGKVDILVGTQMVTKGLDFDQVWLVGVLDVDRMIYVPDFRANERCFQVLTQVSGRSGRRGRRGKVVIQTKNPEDPIFNYVMQHDYEGMYTMELAERNKFLYPPYVKLIKITLTCPDEGLILVAGKLLVHALKSKLDKKCILWPQKPIISKLKNRYIIDIWSKLITTSSKQLALE